MESNKMENQLIENDNDVRKFGKKNNNININHCFLNLLKFFLIMCTPVLIYYFVSYKKNSKLFFNASSIIRNDFDKQIKLINWIEQKLNKNIILELIFKMTENGFTGEDFHHYCDNKGPTLILIKTSNDEIIGGFTPLNWETTRIT